MIRLKSTRGRLYDKLPSIPAVCERDAHHHLPAAGICSIAGVAAYRHRGRGVEGAAAGMLADNALAEKFFVFL